MSPYVIALAMMTVLSPTLDPTARHGALAEAISTVAAEDPLYRNDTGPRTIALLVAVSFRESSLRMDAVGDNGRSFCAFQIHQSSGGTMDLTRDPLACTRRAHAMLKESIRIDRTHPIAFYARGPRYNSPEAQRISNDRMYIANKLARLLD
jgi:hypothetical protein